MIEHDVTVKTAICNFQTTSSTAAGAAAAATAATAAADAADAAAAAAAAAKPKRLLLNRISVAEHASHIENKIIFLMHEKGRRDNS
jgi:pyruvate/2-oxoglutarate dehydrogenase complex dihydrolipoamide acyltransferase (E2) component